MKKTVRFSGRLRGINLAAFTSVFCKFRHHPLSKSRIILLALVIFMLSTASVNAQNCTVNAGVSTTTCNSFLTLSGNTNGNTTGSVKWSLVSGPVVPNIASPNSLNTNVTGMTTPGVYVFQLAQPCTSGDTAKQTVTETVYSQPVFTVSPNFAFCDTLAIDTLRATGTLPTGWTGKWVVTDPLYGTGQTPGLSFSKIDSQVTTVKILHPSKCGYGFANYNWQVTSPNGCKYNSPTIFGGWYPDTLNLDYTRTYTSCGVSTVGFFPVSGCSFANPYAQSLVTVSTITAPAGFTGTITGAINSAGTILLSGLTSQGTYAFSITVYNACKSKTMSFTATVLPPSPTATLITGQNQFICYKSAPSSVALTYTLSDSTAVGYAYNNNTTPSGFPFTVTETGAGKYTRTITLMPNTTWKPGIYTIRRLIRNAADTVTTNPTCPAQVLFNVYILDTLPANLTVATAYGCVPSGSSTTTVTATMPASPSPTTLPGSTWLLTKVSGPSSGATQIAFAPGSNSITGLSVGIYRYKIEPYPSSALAAEIACAGGPQVDTFTVNVYNAAQSNAGTDQTIHCLQNFALAGNIIPSPSYGTWSQVSGPSTITFDNTHKASAIATGQAGSKIGNYDLRWTISDSNNVCPTAFSDVVITTDSACSSILPVTLLSFKGAKQASQTLLDWATTNEIDLKEFTVEWGTNATQWMEIGTVAATGSAGSTNRYSFLHKNPVNGDNFYRLKQVDKDGAFSYSGTVNVNFSGLTNHISVFPNPIKDNINIANAATGSTISVYSIDGRLLLKRVATKQAESIGMGNYAKGVYVLTVTDKDGHNVGRFPIVK